MHQIVVNWELLSVMNPDPSINKIRQKAPQKADKDHVNGETPPQREQYKAANSYTDRWFRHK